ncbi:hypothetical protein THOG05_60075 [Vibrio rotiferianus]|jgi:hypothetical protein|nr:hypothetical protein THOG05_60075 [Vibrio rotiferianus]CAH1565331.1 hypothetical protein THOE12_20795 [Vibrio rotiferianus]
MRNNQCNNVIVSASEIKKHEKNYIGGLTLSAVEGLVYLSLQNTELGLV